MCCTGWTTYFVLVVNVQYRVDHIVVLIVNVQYRVDYIVVLVINVQYTVDCRLRIEIMEMETEPAEDPLDVLRWTDYIAQLADVESSAQDVDIVQLQEDEHGSLPVLLNRYENKY